eukprot:scaffold6055_cov150-Skeletonema_menzelii.AAC.1
MQSAVSEQVVRAARFWPYPFYIFPDGYHTLACYNKQQSTKLLIKVQKDNNHADYTAFQPSYHAVTISTAPPAIVTVNHSHVM